MEYNDLFRESYIRDDSWKEEISASHEASLANLDTHDDHSYAGGDSADQNLSTLLRSLRSSAPPKQEICLSGDDSINTFHIDSRDVDVISSVASGQQISTPASNKVKATPVVNYDWESRYYYGNLVAVHRNGDYLAYVLHKGTPGGGIVRLTNRRTAERTLLKDFNGRVLDIAFEFADEVMLAVIDETGQAYVYRVDELAGKLTSQLAIQILPLPDVLTNEYNRCIWCPYIPEESSEVYDETPDESFSRVLLLTRGQKTEIWYLEAFLPFDKTTAVISSETVEGGVITIDSHTKSIADAAFAPDASAIATAGLDGYVKFFQADIVVPNNPRCLHQWQPHDGRPLSSLCFLDDTKTPEKCLQFWKYCVTGADHNTELKVWTCQTWVCLQTIRFLPSPTLGIGAASETPSLKVVLDPSAHYLMLSDILRKVLYVLEVSQDLTTESGQASFTSISEFLLAQPCLSFVICDTKAKRFKKSLNDSHLDEITTGELELLEEEGESEKGDMDKTTQGVHIKMFAIHAKILQELQIMFKTGPPNSNESLDTNSSFLVDAIRDGLSDLSMDTSHEQPILLTPNAFTSNNYSRGLLSMDGTLNSPSTSSSFTHVTPINDDLVSPHTMSNTQVNASTTPGTVTPSSVTQEFSPSLDLASVTPLDLGDLTPKSSLGDTPRDGAPQPQQPITMDDLNDAVSTVHGSIDSPHSSYMTSITTSLSTDAQFNSILNQPNTLINTTLSDVVTPLEVPPPDENDDEVAEVLAEDNGTTVTVESEDVSPDYDIDLEKSKVNHRPWPQPPDMTLTPNTEVNSEAQRLAELAIETACQIDPSLSVSEDNSFKQVQPETKWDSTHSSGMHDASKDSRTDDDDSNQSSNKATVSVDTLNQLQMSLAQILTSIQQQQRDITQLRSAVLSQQEQQLLFQQQFQEGAALREVVKDENTPDIDSHLVRLEEVMAARVERVLSTQTQRDYVHLEQIVSSNQIQTQERHDQLVTMVQQSLNTTIPHRVERALKQEVKSSVVPVVSKVLDPLKEQLHSELARKLTATDSLLKDSISKLVKSKQTVEAIGQAASQALQGPIQSTYREAFQNVVVPNFEASCQTMYRQIHDTFHNGTIEYTKQLDNHIAKITQKLKESRDPLVHQLQNLVESFKTSSLDLHKSIESGLRDELQSGLQEMGQGIQNGVVGAVMGDIKLAMDGSFKELHESLITDMRLLVKDELGVILREHTATMNETVANAVRSTAATPVPIASFPANQMAQINTLVRQGHINAALEQALSASNIDLVIHTCKLLNAAEVFNAIPFPFQQPVLLSLIQQLSADLSQDTELKHTYLSEALMTLDPTHPITQEHMKGVLHTLCQKLKVFNNTLPTHPLAKALRMLLMAAQSLLNQD